ncbi:DUF1636 domain-containing protein [Swingsia samuiensis]|uniref:DUF1636 domain-containing protein n=1 Tax=Swingsia samuiensis TaxID=1293412 RepID=A0A4Y6UM39_9PROT|nr:DUF1636 domain-containing protein [Swingsia samuiensis]QDH17748.1 DUF1636 domain-containing protein [Swingsia samuiensis]
MVDASNQNRPVLHVCVTCRQGRPFEERPIPGQVFYDKLEEYAAEKDFDLQPVKCFASCARGCVVGVSMPQKWTLLLGHLGLHNLQDFLTYLELYRTSKTGMVMPSKRPQSLSEMVLSRLPMTFSNSQDIL